MDETDFLALASSALKTAPIFDGHNDLPYVIRQDRAARGDVFAYDLAHVRERGDTDIPRLREGFVGAQFWSAFQPTNAPHPARTTLELIDTILRIEEALPGRVPPARSAADFERAREAGKIASYIVIEGGVGLENSLAPLRVWHAAGRADADPLPQRDAGLGRFRHRRAAPQRLQRVRPRRDRRMQPARHDRRRRACEPRRPARCCST